MGNDVSPISYRHDKSGNDRVTYLETKGSDGKVHKMTIRFKEREGSGSLDYADGVQFEATAEDRPFFKAKDIAMSKESIFDNYNTDSEIPTKFADGRPGKTVVNGNLTDVDLSSTPVNLGRFLEAIDELKGNISKNNGNGNGGQGTGASQSQGGGSGSYSFPAMPTLPNCSGIMSASNEYGFRSMMLSDQLDLDMAPTYSGFDTLKLCQAAVNNSVPFFATALKLLQGGFNGGFNSSGTNASSNNSGSNSNSNSAEEAAAKKLEDTKKAKEAEKAERDKKIAEAKEKMEKEVTPIIEEIYASTKGAGTDEARLKKAIGKISKDNVIEVMAAWDKSYAPKMDGESLVKAIEDDTNGFLGFFSDSEEFLSPITKALSERSSSEEVKRQAFDVKREFKIEELEKLCDMVKKEENGDDKDKKIPMIIAVDKEIKAENDKAKAEEDAKAKAKDAADSNKALQTKILEAAQVGVAAESDDTVETLQKKIDAAKLTAQTAAKAKGKKPAKGAKAPVAAAPITPEDAQASARRAAFRARMNEQVKKEQEGGPVADEAVKKDDKKDEGATGTQQSQQATGQSAPAQPAAAPAKHKEPPSFFRRAINRVRNAI